MVNRVIELWETIPPKHLQLCLVFYFHLHRGGGVRYLIFTFSFDKRVGTGTAHNHNMWSFFDRNWHMLPSKYEIMTRL